MTSESSSLGGWEPLHASAEAAPTPAPRSLQIRRLTAFVIAASAISYLALRGGAYDPVVRQEAGLAIWAALTLGFAVGAVPRARLGPRELLPLAAFAGLALLTLLSLAWTSSSERTWAELSRVALYAGVLAVPLLTLNRYTWRAAAGGVMAAALGVSIFAVATRLSPAHLPTDEVAQLIGGDRLSYPLNYWNAVGAWASIAAAMGLAWSAHTKLNWARMLTLAAVPTAVACEYLTYSRGGALGLAVGAIAVLAVSRNRWTAVVHGLAVAGAAAIAIAVIRSEPAIANGTGGAGGARVAVALIVGAMGCAAVALVTASAELDRFRLEQRLARRIAPVAIGVVLIAALVAGAGALGDAWDEFQQQGATAPAPASDPAARLTTATGTRSDVWEAAFDAFESKPLGGIGPGTFEFYWSQHSTTGEFLRDAHSLYLEELAELGLPGLLLLLAILGSAVWLAIRARLALRRSSELAASSAMLSGAIVFLFAAGIDWMWEVTAVSALGLVALGILCASQSERWADRRITGGARAGLAAVALAAAIIQIPALVSTARVRDSADALATGRMLDAAGLAEDGIEAEPWSATAHLERAAVATVAGDLNSARSNADSAIEHEPLNWRPHLALVQIELAVGSRADAEAAYDQLRELSLDAAVPYDSFAALARDPTLTAAARQGCLAYTVGACGSVASPFERSDCRDAPATALSAIELTHGVRLDRAVAIRGVLGEQLVFYVAGEVGDQPTTWALDAGAYRDASGSVVALDRAAIDLSHAPDLPDPTTVGLSDRDDGAVAARACL
jgi:O-Antigen ligase